MTEVEEPIYITPSGELKFKSAPPAEDENNPVPAPEPENADPFAQEPARSVHRAGQRGAGIPSDLSRSSTNRSVWKTLAGRDHSSGVTIVVCNLSGVRPWAGHGSR